MISLDERGNLLSCAPVNLVLVSLNLCALGQLSEVAIPHYLAATIFSASNAAKERFQHNARLLVIMTVACGVFR